ncbi:MAG: hypothetical protein HY870_18900 [Chloroflexi bacterium]|nr:hypothetical protein [Chloroflexota bacterium]
MPEIIWTDYLKYRAGLRGFELAQIEQIVKYSSERYFDTETRRLVIIGRVAEALVLVPCDLTPSSITPVTIHVTTRQQISFRLKAGRFTHE